VADNKKYYYMRLKEGFFDEDAILLLEGMDDGYLYTNILLKMYLRSLKTEGCLMFNNIIPYSPQMLASIVHHPVGVVEKALNLFTQMGLIEVLEDGAIYMMNIQNYIGKSSTEADRQREYDRKISEEKKTSRKLQEILKKSTPEIEIEKEIEIEIKKELKTKLELETEKGTKCPSDVEGLSEDNVLQGKKAVKKKPSVYFPEDELLDKTFKDFIQMRKKIRKPMTDRAIELMITKLDKLAGNDNDKKVEILNNSIVNSWSNIYELKSSSNNNSKQINWDEV